MSDGAAGKLIISTFLVCLFICLQPGTCAQNDSLPYCNSALDSKTGFLVEPIHDTDAGLLLYDVLYKTPKTVVHDDCVIASRAQHSLRIGFDRMKLVSDILINAKEAMSDGTNNNKINVSLWQGSTAIQCKATERTVTVFADTFVVFSCLDSGIGHPTGVLASAVEITSATSKTLDLKHLREFGILGWLMIMERTMDDNSEHLKNCPPPGLYSDQILRPAKSVYLPGDIVKIVCASPKGPHHYNRTCLSTGKWSGDQPQCANGGADSANQKGSLSKECPPIDPYPGMPNSYKNYELVVDGSINELLVNSPCQKHYQFDGKLTEINQCKDGAWIGKGFPKCKPIMIKTPPKVDHAHWIGIDDDSGLVSEIVYVCESGYYATMSGKTFYSVENEEWTNVPQCLGLFEHLSRNYFEVVVSLTVVILCVIVGATIAFVLIKAHKSRKRVGSTLKTNTIYTKIRPRDSMLLKRDSFLWETGSSTATSNVGANQQNYATTRDLVRDLSHSPSAMQHC